jgi:hypothetical protein
MGTRSAITVPEGRVAEGEIFRPIVEVGLYTFTVESFRITDTRSLHNDTDYVSLAVSVGLNPPVTVPAKSMGDVNNGTHAVNLSIPNVAVGPNDAVAFTYSIVNSGYSSNLVEEALQKAVSAASSKAAAAAAGAVGGALGGPAGSILSVVGTAAFGWLAGKLEGVIFPDCDGVVAGADHAYTGEQLVTQTANGKVITVSDLNKGTNSPDGCGANSVYYVTWSISTQPPSGSGGVVGGGGQITDGPPHRED